MAIAKGMTNREWNINEKARCLQYLLTSVIESVDEMRTSYIENVSKLAEAESEGDAEIRYEREQYYLNVFNISIPDDMEQIFLQSMVVQICTYIESILKDIAQNKKQDKGFSNIESLYNHIQKEKNKCLGLITNHITDWLRLHKMRNDITHNGYTTEHLTQQYIEKTIEEARSFLMTVEKA